MGGLSRGHAPLEPMAAATPIARLTPFTLPSLYAHPELTTLANLHTGPHAPKYNYYKMARTITLNGINLKSYTDAPAGEISLDTPGHQHPFKLDITIPWDLELLSEATKILRNRAQVAQRWAEGLHEGALMITVENIRMDVLPGLNITGYVSFNATHIEISLPRAKTDPPTNASFKLKLPYNLALMSEFVDEYLRRVDTIREALGAKLPEAAE